MKKLNLNHLYSISIELSKMNTFSELVAQSERILNSSSPSPLPVGSLHVWIHDLNPKLSIAAVQLKGGAVLQRNDIVGDKIHYHETFYPSLAAWHASLPQYGRMKIHKVSSDDPKWLNWSLPDDDDY